MNELVFLKPNKLDAIPFTTSEIIAEKTGINRRKIRDAIRKYKTDLEAFGKVASYQAPLPGSKTGQTIIGYILNEQQATFLLTLLKNTPVVVNFKKELVRQFYAMRAELLKRQLRRAELKPIRRELTDIIQEVDDSRWAYKKYTDLAYKSGLGKNAAQLRKERNAPKKAKAVDYMTADEIAVVSKRQSQIAVLLDMGLSYPEIKGIVSGPVALKAANA